MDRGANLDWAKDVPCRNITIHGFCKYEGKGCSFKHETNNNATKSAPIIDSTEDTSTNDLSFTSRPSSTTSSVTLTGSKKFNPASSSTFLPTSISNPPNLSAAPTKPVNKYSGISPKLSNIPSFVPSSSINDDVSSAQNGIKQFNMDSPAFQPSADSPSQSMNRSPVMANPYLAKPAESIQSNMFVSLQSDDMSHIYSPLSGQDFMFQQANSYPQQSAYPLNHHLYAPAPPPRLQVPLKNNEQNAAALFLPEDLRVSLLKKNDSTLKTLQHSNLPDLVGVYYDLVPLDNSLQKSDTTYGYNSSLYKAFSNHDGQAYVLRRIENVKLNQDKSILAIKKWIKLNSANIANVVDAFTSRSFGDNSLIVVYDYYPNSNNLVEQHFHSNLGTKPEPVTPKTLWTYAIQLTNAIATAHAKSLPTRSISLQKVIVTSRDRIRISGCGVFDILDYDEHSDGAKVELLMEEDLRNLGNLLLTLASSTSANTSRFSSPEDIISNIDCDDLFRKMLTYLLNEESLSVSHLQHLISPKLFEQLNSSQENADYYEAQLTRELENGRLVRLLTKLNFITDRPEYAQNPIWSQSGERYPIKLFKEYVFHQVDEAGKPVLDLAFVLKCLNKLDAGVDEKILLVSHDEQNCLIVSYKEIRDLIQRSFRDLSN